MDSDLVKIIGMGGILIIALGIINSSDITQIIGACFFGGAVGWSMGRNVSK